MSTFYSGRVQTIKYAQEADAFYILQMQMDDSKRSVTVKGHVPGISIAPGTWFGFEAREVQDPRFGWQLQIVRAPVFRDQWTPDVICNMLVGSGVGSALMQSIRAHHGDDDLTNALDDWTKIAEVAGVGEFSARHVHESWLAAKLQFKVMDFLSNLGLPHSVLRTVWKHFRDDTQQVLTQNPWALVQVEGITFQDADQVAQNLGVFDFDAQVKGAVLAVVKTGRGFGHLFSQNAMIFFGVRALIQDCPQAKIVKAMADLHKEGLIVLDRKTRPGTTAVYEPWCYQMEVQSARLIRERQVSASLESGGERTERYLKALGSVGPQTAATVAGGDLKSVVWTAIDEWGSQAHLVLSDDQKQGVFNALTAPISVLSGLPGTGKTTSLKAAVQVLQDAGVPFLLCAPTGIAAKNLHARTGAPASTIHRAFAARGLQVTERERTYTGVTGDSNVIVGIPGEEQWGYHAGDPHPAQVVIVDESSMVDQHLLYRLLHCTNPEARLVFVGDHAQLPSVGPGNVLRDLINSEMFPTVKLEQIFRQEDTSGIVYASHAIHKGEVPETDKDFKLISLGSDEEVQEAVLKIAVKLFEKRENFQILSPRHQGVVGVTTLNERLRELLNPAMAGKAEMKMGNRTVREGDRVMVVRNQYKLRVFNGDIGKVAKIDTVLKEIEVKVFGAPPLFVRIPFAQAKILSLAYATTVHKAQGMEYDQIVMPLVGSFQHQLQRNLLYTAITRARKRVLLLGDHTALARAVYNAREDERMTLLLDRLVESAA